MAAIAGRSGSGGEIIAETRGLPPVFIWHGTGFEPVAYPANCVIGKLLEWHLSRNAMRFSLDFAI
jgi:hypothetical protein